jgi:2-(1,2-epoxy-1,2-dihydrophenyl)acetyl-CoA isomerase
MKTYTTVTVDSLDSVALVRLNRPEDLNAFNRQLCLDLADALRSVSKDASVRVVVLGGHGRVFSAGADLKVDMPDGATVTKRLREEFKPGLMAIVEMDKPVISVIQGSAAGIGLAYALAADLVVMGESAFLLSPFANIALIPDGGLNWILPLAVGYRRAYQMAVECERISATQAHQWGLANRVVPDDQLMDNALHWAGSLALRSPMALSLTKRAMRSALDSSFAEMIDREAELQAACIESQDFREGVTAFLEKRKPRFLGT